MKHLISFENFAHHSQDNGRVKESIKDHENIEKHKCFKCKKRTKPHYNPTTREIPRLF